MATLTIEEAPVTGLDDVTFVAADTLGDDAPTGAGVFLLVRNDDATTAHVVTVDTPGTVRGLTIENPAVTVVTNGGIAVVPLLRSVFGASASISYSAVTSLFVAVVRLAR